MVAGTEGTFIKVLGPYSYVSVKLRKVQKISNFHQLSARGDASVYRRSLLLYYLCITNGFVRNLELLEWFVG